LPVFGQHLPSSRSRLACEDSVGLESGFLADKAGGDHGIEIISGGFAPQRGFVREAGTTSSRRLPERRKFFRESKLGTIRRP